MRNFDPWVGSLYSEGGLNGLKVLILGESHYGTPPESRDFTSKIIKRWGQKEPSKFYTKTQRVVSLDRKRGSIPVTRRTEFWEKVAFYNYVQHFVGTKSRVRPTSTMWDKAKAPFLETVLELAPHVIVALGKELNRNLPQIPENISVAKIIHPSGRGFNYKDSQEIVKSAYTRAFSSLQNTETIES